MSVSRLASVFTLLLAACAGWESSTPTYATPPTESPTPSHYAPPPPDQPPAPEPPPEPPPSSEIRVAIASVQLLDDCPEPAEPAATDSRSEPVRRSVEQQGQSIPSAKSRPGGPSFAPSCTQSTVQLTVNSDIAGSFRIEASRILAGTTKTPAGTTTLRKPTRWDDASGTYGPWDARVVAGKPTSVSYKLGALEIPPEKNTADFNQYFGPFILELDVSIDGERQTIRSAEFTREPPHVMVT